MVAVAPDHHGQNPGMRGQPHIATERLVMRPLRGTDARALARVADDPRIAVNLRDGFPSPYGLLDARRFLSWLASGDAHPLTSLGIVRDGELIGCMGMTPGPDVYRYTGEVGYWLGVDHWGTGLATEALSAFTDHLLRETRLVRLQGNVFSGNPASGRVLEKCGYRLESVQRRAVVKNGVIRDLAIYVRLREDPPC